MSLDTRAGRAAVGVRASAHGVNAMAQLTELKHENDSRRRTRRGAVAAVAAVVVLFAAWFGFSNIGRSSSSPPATPPTSPAVDMRSVVGNNLVPAYEARVPDNWTTECNCGFIWLTRHDVVVEASSLLTAVNDPATNAELPMPADLAAWIRSHPWLTVLSDGTTTVDGVTVPRITFETKPGARSVDDADPGFLKLVKASQIPEGQPWFDGAQEGPVTWVIIPRGSGVEIVAAFGAVGPEAQAELDAGLSEYLASIDLP